MKYIIYALLCPKCGSPRYVGQSQCGVSRYTQHLRGMSAKDSSIYKKHWVQSLLDKGLRPEFRVLLVLPDQNHLDAAEIFWIAEMRRRGFPLTNLTDGGCGRTGHKDTAETKQKRAKHFRGVPKTQECKDKIAASLTGRPSPKKGRPLTPEEIITHAAARAIPPFQDQHGRVYETLKEAAEMWNLEPGNICNVLKRKRKSSGGLVFTYIHELESKVAMDRQRLEDIEKSKQATKERNYARTKAWKQAHRQTRP